ncbi:MAG: hypothetical protein K2Q12_02125 [Rickettsiales bacterium]|nr:hypothetical protein [Rickettsiales bacterium]
MIIPDWTERDRTGNGIGANPTGGHVAALDAKKQVRPPSNELLTVADISAVFDCVFDDIFGSISITAAPNHLDNAKIWLGRHSLISLFERQLKDSFGLNALKNGTTPKTRRELNGHLQSAIDKYFAVVTNQSDADQKNIPPQDDTKLSEVNELLKIEARYQNAPLKMNEAEASYLREYAGQLRDTVMNSLPKHVCEMSGYEVG